MSLDHKIKQIISLGAPAISRQGFGTVLILGTATFDERVKFYGPDDVFSSDAELSQELKDALAIAFSQNPEPTRVAVGRRDDAGTPEAVEEALQACLEESDQWFGFCLETRDEADILAAAQWAELRGRLFFAQSSDGDIITSDTNDIASQLKDKNYEMTALAYLSDNSKYFDVAWMVGFLGHSFDQTAPTAVYNTIKGIAPDLSDTSAQTHAEGKNANYYSTLKGIGATFGGTVANGFDIEHVVTGEWVKARLSEAIATLFLETSARGSRVPFNDQGIAMIEQATFDVLLLGERLGHFNPGTSEAEMPRRADIAAGDLEQGLLRYKWGAQYSGTIKEVSIQGYVSLDFEGFESA